MIFTALFPLSSVLANGSPAVIDSDTCDSSVDSGPLDDAQVSDTKQPDVPSTESSETPCAQVPLVPQSKEFVTAIWGTSPISFEDTTGILTVFAGNVGT